MEGRIKEIERKKINWKSTGEKLQFLRLHNANLRRYVCGMLKYGSDKCCKNCDSCDEELDMDKSISQNELAKALHVNMSKIANWENNKSNPSIEDLWLYADICELDLLDILILE